MAGLNAAGAGAVLDRAEAYIGVMIDDLVTRGADEPYRMFTSRAEFRLSLRADNADQRLTARGEAWGCVGAARRQAFAAKTQALAEARARLAGLSASPSQIRTSGLAIAQDGVRRTAFELLGRPDMGLGELARLWPELADLSPAIAEQLEIEGRYAGYLDRQEADILAFRRDEALDLPAELDYGAIGGPLGRMPGQAGIDPSRDPGPGGPHPRHDPGGAHGPAAPCPAPGERAGAGPLRLTAPPGAPAPQNPPYTAAAFAEATGVSRETLARLEGYAALLVKWQKAINLVAPDSLPDLWRRHMLDSAALFPLIPATARVLVDLGSGAGFPGLVLAIMGVPEVHLVESDTRKCAFLSEGARLFAPGRVTVHRARIEAAPAIAADVVTARALADLPKLLAYAAPFLAPDGICLFPKGRRVEDELTLAKQTWTMAVERVANPADPSGIILRIKGLAR